MTPGTYLRLRREAAGLSIEDVVMLITPDEDRWPLAILYTALVERDQVTPSAREIDALRFAFAFDPYVFRQLVARLDPAPELCLRCGCSALDPCRPEHGDPCAWANAAHDLCTTCAAAGATTPGE